MKTKKTAKNWRKCKKFVKGYNTGETEKNGKPTESMKLTQNQETNGNQIKFIAVIMFNKSI